MKAKVLLVILVIFTLFSTTAFSQEIDDSVLLQLVDPSMTTRTEIDNLQFECNKIIESAAIANKLGQDSSTNDQADLVSKLCEIFLKHTLDGPNNQMVELATSSNPALARARQIINLPPPQGFAFVRYIDTDQETDTLNDPELKLKKDTVNPGYTILTRYITIDLASCLEGAKNSQGESSETVTLSHELIHAYVGSIIGCKNLGKLPAWFREGLAVYITGSSSVRIGNARESYEQSTSYEYIGYLQLFNYLERLKGRDTINKYITQAISDKDVLNPLRSIYKIESYEILSDIVKRKNNLDYGRNFLIFLVVILTIRLFFIERTEEPKKFTKNTLLLIFCLVLILWVIPYFQYKI